jgi:hypothetical protein
MGPFCIEASNVFNYKYVTVSQFINVAAVGL